MPIEITMPRLSDTMEEGTLVKWKVKVGDKVKNGDNLADVETDKATMELNAFDDGSVAVIAVKEGETAAVGKLIAVLAAPDEKPEEVAKAYAGGGAAAAEPKGEKQKAKATAEGEEEAQARAKAETRGTSAAQEKRAATTPAPSGPAVAEDEEAGDEGDGGGRLRVSPLARRIAEDRGIDLAQVKGTGPEGRIIKRDVLNFKPAPAGEKTAKPQAAAAGAPAPLPKLESRVIPVSNMRKTIARRLVESKSTIPHFTVTVGVNTDPLMSLRTTLNQQLESQKIKLSVNDFIVRGCAIALQQHPLINASWTEQGIQQYGSINIGVAVALPQDKGGGLVVPVIRDVQAKGLRAISAETRTLAEKARGTGLSVQEMADGTFTISNLGMLGVEHFEAIINPPQAAILAVGAALQKPVVRNGQLAVGTEMTLTLSADHRVIDGAMAAEFLQTLKGVLENPAALLV